MQASFWERDYMLDTDFIVLGAGLLGLQTALELRARATNARIRVLERGALPCGASTRDAATRAICCPEPGSSSANGSCWAARGISSFPKKRVPT